MKRLSLVVFATVLWLATCSAPQPDVPVPLQTDAPATETAVPPTPTEAPVSEGKLPAAPFESQVYSNEEAGFALDYPAGWTVNETVVGPRGTQVQFLSSPELVDIATLPEGTTRLSANIYEWDPKNDLVAFVANQKNAWSGSGFTILDEQQLTLELGLPAVQFTIQTPESQAVFLIAALEDRYLVISGEGNLELVQQIVQRVRPISN